MLTLFPAGAIIDLSSGPGAAKDSRARPPAAARKQKIGEGDTMKITETYEGLPKILKLILQFFFGGIIGGVYRIVRFFETKNIVTLVVGLLCTFTGLGNVLAWIVDFITELIGNRISVLAD
jgi:hypothetical protein